MGTLYLAKGPTFFQIENYDTDQIMWMHTAQTDLNLGCMHMSTFTLR